MTLGERGPPVVLIHGTNACWQHWIETIFPLAVGRRVIAPDMPGTGSSPLPDWRITPERYAEWILELLDELDVRRADLVGHSFGGLVAVAAARRAPARVRRLVLVGGTPFTALRFARSPLATAISDPGAAAVLAGEVITGLLGAPGFAHDSLASRRRLRTLALWYVVDDPAGLDPAVARELIRGAGKAGLAQTLLAHRSCRDILEQPLEHPTLALHGRRDRVVPLRDLEAFACHQPAAQIAVIDGAAHLPMLEASAQVNARIKAFLDEADRSEDERQG